MNDSEAALTASTVAKVREDPARPWLIALAVAGSFVTVTGTFVFCYPNTLASIRRMMILVHDVGGDLTLILAVGYLNAHLRRTWKMKRLKVSRWTGYAVIALWIAAGGTGVYGQLRTLSDAPPAYYLHLVSSIALVVLACVHGAWGFRYRIKRAGAKNLDAPPA